jgi:hypothetical protein
MERMLNLAKIIGLEETHGVPTGVREDSSVWLLEKMVLVLKMTALLVSQALLNLIHKSLTSTELKNINLIVFT